MQNYTFYIIFLAVVLCIFFIVVIIHYGKANLTIIIIGFGFIFLISGIVICLYLINDLLDKLNNNTKQIEVDLSEIKLNVDNIHTDLVGSSTLITDILFLNPTKGLSQDSFEDLEKSSKDIKENISSKRIYDSNILTTSVQILLDNLNKNKQDIDQVQENLNTVASDVKDNVVEAIKVDLVLQNTLASSPALQEGIINSPALETAIVNNQNIIQAITSSPILQQFLTSNPDFINSIINSPTLRESFLNSPELHQQRVELEAALQDISNNTQNFNNMSVDVTKIINNINILDDYLKFIDKTIGFVDKNGNIVSTYDGMIE